MKAKGMLKVILGVAGATAIAVAAFAFILLAGPTPEDVLAASAERIDEIESLSFTMNVVTEAEGVEAQMVGEGSIELPATMAMSGTMEVLGQEATYEQILVDKTMYMRFSPDDQWYSQPFDISQVQGSNALPTDYLTFWEAFGAVEDAGVDEVDGVDCRHYILDIDETRLWDVMMGQLEEMDLGDVLEEAGAELDMLREVYESSTITIDIWIGVDDDLPRREIVDMNTTAPVPTHVSATLHFSGFNEPVDVQAPEGAIPMDSLTTIQ